MQELRSLPQREQRHRVRVWHLQRRVTHHPSQQALERTTDVLFNVRTQVKDLLLRHLAHSAQVLPHQSPLRLHH